MSDFLENLFAIGKKIVAVSKTIEDASDSTRRSTSTASEVSDASSSARPRNSASQTTSTLFQRHIANGYRDPLELLSHEAVEEFLGAKIQVRATHSEDEYMSHHYSRVDEPSIYVELSVSAGMPWDFITDEAATGPSERAVGDASVIGHDTLYVKRKDVVFWVYSKGVNSSIVYRIAEYVASQIA